MIENSIPGEPHRHVPVVIIGSGPTGLTLANLLGRLGIATELVERHATTVTEPRAVSIDDESLRTMQAAGVIDAVLREVVPGYGSHYHGPDGRCFAKVEPTGTPFGYPRRNAFRQPILEQQLRDNLAASPCVTTSFGWTFARFTDEGPQVRVDLTAPDGTAHSLTCDFLIGCDGASSAVREQLGITLGGTTFDERWLIVDLENHPNAQRHTKVFCNPRRPCITLPGPHDTRRYEFKLMPGETDADMLAPEKIAHLLATHDAHPGATIRRKVVYRFHARVADRWSRGRVFLAGDAAHLTPPFAGQGMNSGLRDAQNLAWKLACVLQGQAGPGLLESYALERRDHMWAMIRLALRMGQVMAPRGPRAGWAIRAAFTVLRLWPPASDYVLQMKYKPKPRFTRGFLLSAGSAAPELVGRLFPQPRVRNAEGDEVLLDTLLGPGFCLLARTDDPAPFARLTHPVWDRLGAARVTIGPPFSDVIVLLRPDRHVAAAFTAAQAEAVAQALADKLAATW